MGCSASVTHAAPADGHAADTNVAHAQQPVHRLNAQNAGPAASHDGHHASMDVHVATALQQSISGDIGVAGGACSTPRGLTLRGLRLLRARVQQLCAEGFFHGSWELYGQRKEGADTLEQLSTEQLIFQWVKREVNVRGEAALVDALCIALPDEPVAADGLVGPPTYFVSHAWKGRAVQLLDTIQDFLRNAADTTAVWLDFVAIDQRSGDDKANDEALHAFVSRLDSILHSCEGGVLAVVDMSSPESNPASRAWCTFEWDHCMARHGAEGLHMHGMSIDDRTRIISSIQQERAQCGGIHGPQMLSMINADIIAHHGSLSAFDTYLKLQLLLEPLSFKVDLEQLGRRGSGTHWAWSAVQQWLDDPAAGRALCVLAGAGTGKSTVSAALCKELFGRKRQDDASLWTGPISAWHFLKFSDQRRLDPVRIIKTLAYQLAIRVDAVAAALLANDPKAVSELHDMDAAFKMLLAGPLAGVPDPIYILLDAVDEADPPEQQEPGFEGGVKAGANRALVLAVRLMAEQLPRNVRFLFTTRPEAACGNIKDVLERAFSDVLFLTPGQLRDQGHGGHCSAASAGSPQAAGSAHRQYAGPHGAGNFQTSPIVRQRCSDGDDGVLVAEAVISEYRRQGLPLPPSLVGLSQTLSASRGSHSLQEVHSVYGAVFDSARPSADARELLEVLMAAQEPLSNAMLQRMGLADALPLLPGWGVLFYIADHHVYFLHKSLTDWLHREGWSGRHAVDVRPGHLLLGLELTKDVVAPSFKADSQLPSYCVKYSILHLCSAGTEASQRLHEVLAQWGFLRQVFKARQGGRALTALSRMPAAERSAYAEDTMRWLRRGLSTFEGDPHNLEASTMSWDLSVLASDKYKEAVARVNPTWVEWRAMGGNMGSWPPDLATYAVLPETQTVPLTSVCFSPDDTQLATGRGHEARVWDLGSGQCLAVLAAPTQRASSQQQEGGLFYHTLQVAPRVHSVSFSFNGRQLAAGCSDNTAQIWDLATTQCVTTMLGHTGAVNSVCFASEDQLVTGSDDGTAKVWDVNSGQCVTTLQGDGAAVVSVCVSPRGQLVTGGRSDSIWIWNLEDQKCSLKVQAQPPVCSVCVSPDGAMLAAACSDHLARVWDMTSGECVVALQGHLQGEHLQCVNFSRDGQHVASCGTDNLARVWHLPSKQCVATLQGHMMGVSGVHFSSDGRLATAAGDSTAKLWDLALAPCELQGHLADILSVSLSADGLRAATGSADETAKVWSVDTGQCVVTLTGHKGCVTSVCLSADGTLLATGSNDATAKLWQVEGSRCAATFVGHTASVSALSMSPCGKRLATASTDMSARVWELASGDCIWNLQGHTRDVLSVCFKADGLQLATGGADGLAKVWCLATGDCCMELCVDDVPGESSESDKGRDGEEPEERESGGEQSVGEETEERESGDEQSSVGEETEEQEESDENGDVVSLDDDAQWLSGSANSVENDDPPNGVNCVCFSPDGKYLATGSVLGRCGVIWDLATQQCATILQAQRSEVKTMCFSPDGRTVLVTHGSYGWAAKLYDTSSGQCLTTLQGHRGNVRSACFDGTGRQVVTGGMDRVAKVWRLNRAA